MDQQVVAVDPVALRLERLRKRLRQRDVASDVGAVPQRISDFENGLRHPSAEQVVRLIKLLGPSILVDPR